MKRLVPFLAMILIGLASGCGSDDNPTQPVDPAGAQAEVEAGNDALAAGDYAGANAHYKAAIEKDPSNSQARVGAAVTEIYLVQSDPEVAGLVNQLGGGTPAPQPGPATASRAIAGRPSVLQVSPGADFGPRSMGRAFFKTLALAADDPPAISEIQLVIRLRVMPRLQYAEDCLNVAEADPNFVFPVVVQVGDALDTLEIDRGELFMLDSVINGVQGWLGMLVAYNFDVPNSDFENVNPESLLAAGTDWATLHTDGALVLAAAKANFLLVNVRFDDAVASIQAETDDQTDDVITQEYLASQEFAETAAGVDQLDAAMRGPVNVEAQDYAGNPFPLQVDLGRFFVPAINDLKTKLPDHTFDVNHDPQITAPITFPDPVINGIFPDMTNARWQALTGITAPAAIALRPGR